MKRFFLVSMLLLLVTPLFAQWWMPSATNQANYSRNIALETIFKNVPIPPVQNAIERKMVSWRATMFDVENRLGYVYIICSGLGPIGYYTIFGKVASLNSYLVPEYDKNTNSDNQYDKPVADLDGTYGHNIEGVFFRTSTGGYVEIPTSGPVGYLYSTEPPPTFLNLKQINK